MPYAALASEEESRPLLEAATAAAQVPPEPDAQDLGRGKRKRPEQGSLAELGERAFMRLMREEKQPGPACAPPASRRKQ